MTSMSCHSSRGIEEVRGYKPPADVEDRLQALTEDVYGDVSDWRNQQLNDKYKKYHVRRFGRIMRKPMFWFTTWSGTNQAVQLQKMARGLKFRI